MAAPDLKATTLVVKIDAKLLILTTSFQDLFASVAAEFNIHLSALYMCCVEETTTAKVTVAHRRSSVDYYLAYKEFLSVSSSGRRKNLLGPGGLNLIESDVIKAKVETSPGGIVHLIAPFTSYTD